MDADLRGWVSGALSVGNVTAGRSLPWADIWRVEAADGIWWLKVNKAGTVHEPRLLSLLAGLGSPLVPEVRTRADRPWSLIADAGVSARQVLPTRDRDERVRFWCDLLASYADLQRRTVVEDLLNAGLADFRPQLLAQRYSELCADHAWFNPPAVRFDATERRRISSLGARISAACAELADGVAATVQHDDLHDDNVLLDGDDLRTPRVIDWGDAVIAHPFGTLRLTLDSLCEELSGPELESDLGRITSAYLEGWRTGGTSEAELRRQLELARWLECISRSACWIRSLGSVQVGLDQGSAGSPAGWLQMMADEADAVQVGAD